MPRAHARTNLWQPVYVVTQIRRWFSFLITSSYYEAQEGNFHGLLARYSPNVIRAVLENTLIFYTDPALRYRLGEQGSLGPVSHPHTSWRRKVRAAVPVFGLNRAEDRLFCDRYINLTTNLPYLVSQ